MKNKSYEYAISGMHCAACANVVARTLKKTIGVVGCEVNSVSEKVKISTDGRFNIDDANTKLKELGYYLFEQENFDEVNKKEIDIFRKKVIVLFPLAMIFFILMLLSLIFEFDKLILNSIGFVASSIVILLTGKKYFKAVWSFFTKGNGNMDSLVGLGVIVAYLYSSFLWFFPNIASMFHTSHLFFDVVVVVVGFVYLGKYLEIVSKKKTGEAVESLISMQSKDAWVKRNGKFVNISVNQVVVGDLIMVKSGDRLPVDGEVVEGESYVGESMISGEAVPVKKTKGHYVFAASLNSQGTFIYKSVKVGKDTLMGRIIDMVTDAQNSKAAVQSLVDKISAIFVPTALLISIFTFIYWSYMGMTEMAIMGAVGVLVIACPCALGLATPLGVVVGVGKAAKLGILFKNAQALENLEKIKTIVFDKTGTITMGKPVVEKYDLKSLSYAYYLEENSNHPLALAICEKAKELGIKKVKISGFKEIEGIGVEGYLLGKKIEVRKPQEAEINNTEVVNMFSSNMSVVVVLFDNKYVGAIGITDEIKTGVSETIEKINKLKINTILLSGDKKQVADYVGKTVGIKNIISEVMPDAKYKVIKDLQKDNQKVVMVGDGINDAPALAVADVSIAMSTGTDIAINSADITLLGGDVRRVYEAIIISRQTMRVIRQNLFWAFIYNVVGIPLAAGVFINLLGLMLSPVYAGSIMALSSVSVVFNSLRLRFIKV